MRCGGGPLGQRRTQQVRCRMSANTHPDMHSVQMCCLFRMEWVVKMMVGANVL